VPFQLHTYFHTYFHTYLVHTTLYYSLSRMLIVSACSQHCFVLGCAVCEFCLCFACSVGNQTFTSYFILHTTLLYCTDMCVPSAHTCSQHGSVLCFACGCFACSVEETKPLLRTSYLIPDMLHYVTEPRPPNLLHRTSQTVCCCCNASPCCKKQPLNGLALLHSIGTPAHASPCSGLVKKLGFR
jgi:hypothetical protein